MRPSPFLDTLRSWAEAARGGSMKAYFVDSSPLHTLNFKLSLKS